MSELESPAKNPLSVSESSIVFALSLMVCEGHPERMRETVLRFVRIWATHQATLDAEV